ncbi:S-layer homology domain-containing protein [Paenibacillus sp. NEAU-GSW1]|uniref:S-layer homology domain-containing protein n=1 Tax=Paenibacillus sp. NEAU-GSW1 TaxID=2682486 RepID=UPI00139C757F|nr:S-layer homology domain-containing protein [Paenibacillus sp. NEAU-GSW1]MUT64597.1 tandem-95 repeat protein [Paenibacillus sp. NEAU-GSW1]
MLALLITLHSLTIGYGHKVAFAATTTELAPMAEGFKDDDGFYVGGDGGSHYVGIGNFGQTIAALKYDLSGLAGKKIVSAVLRINVTSSLENAGEMFIDLKVAENDGWTNALPAGPWGTIYQEKADLPAQGSTGFFTFDNSDDILTYVKDEYARDQKITFVLEGNEIGGGGTITELGFEAGTAKLIVTTEPNNAPTASNSSLTVTEDVAKTATLSASDADSDPLEYSIVDQPSKGTVAITNTATGDFSYTPDLNETGNDSFTFQAYDGAAYSTKKTVSVTINPVNDAPVASNGSLSVTEDVAANGDLSATDIDSGTLTYSIVALPAKGTIAFTNAATGEYTYTPNANATGNDTFTFKVRDDNSVDSNIATVSVTINNVNDAPAATDGVLAVTEDTAATGTLVASDADGNPLTYWVDAQGAKGTVVINSSTGEYTYTPNLNATGLDSFKLKAYDNQYYSNAATISVTISSEADAPAASNGTLIVAEDSSANAGALSATDAENDALTYSIVDSPAKGSVVITNTATGAYTYTPNANATGNDTFTFRAKDAALFSNTATVTVTINNVNDPPVANGGTLAVTEDTAANGILTSSDIDEGETQTYSVIDQGGKGTVSITNASTGAYTYTPNADATGTDTFTFQVNDGEANSNIATINITINGENDAPVANPGTLSVTEDTAKTGRLSAADSEGDDLTYSIVGLPGKGTVTLDDSSTGDFTYTPSPNATGSDSFTFKASDIGLLDSGIVTISVTIAAVNDAPVAIAGTLAVTEDTSNSGILEASDVDGDSLKISIEAQGDKGTVELLNEFTGAYSYTPNLNASGTDTFQFKASDEHLDSSIVTVTVTIAGVNDLPVASDGTLSVTEDTVKTGSLSATDVEGDTLTYSVVSQGGKGTVAITNAATGAFTYTPNLNETGADSFAFRAADGDGNSNIATVAVEIAGVNDAPVANAGTLSATEETAAAAILSATDSEGDGLTYSIADQPSKGSVVITDPSTGAYTYTPNVNATGSDSFTFTAKDSALTSVKATISVTIAGVNDVPVAADIVNVQVKYGKAKTDSFTATDVDGDTLTYSIVEQGTLGTATVTGNTFTYTPKRGASGKDKFKFQVSDGNGGTAQAYVNVKIATPGGTVPKDPEHGRKPFPIGVDGAIQEEIATVETSQAGGRTVTTVSFDEEKLLKEFKGKPFTKLTISLDEAADQFALEISGELFKGLDGHAVVIELRTPLGTYLLPLSQMPANNAVRLTISKPEAGTLQAMQSAVNKNGAQLVAGPVDFEITVSSGDKQQSVARFAQYVQRMIPLPSDTEPGVAFTGVVLESNGAIRHVPTAIVKQDGVYYAVISSLTNSTYAVIRKTSEFADTAGHWSEDEVNDLGSRLIVQGDKNGNFLPDQAISRAEFVAIVARGLGLKAADGNGAPAFSDVSASDWFAQAIAAAVSYGLVDGYKDGRFLPNQNITRVEAIAIMARAMKLAGAKDAVDETEAESLLAAFADQEEVAVWARNVTATVIKAGIVRGNGGELKPDAPITRAETAAMVRRLLQQAHLID